MSNSSTTTPALLCPPPLVPTPQDLISIINDNFSDVQRSFFCAQGCCLPCPSLKYVYPPGVFENVWRYHIPIFYGLGSLAALAMLITHLVVPTRRFSPSTPSIILVQLGLILVGSSLFVAVPDPTLLQCASGVIKANGFNNNRCFVQGSLFTLGINLATVFAFNLIFIQHLAIVWSRGPDLHPLKLPAAPSASSSSTSQKSSSKPKHSLHRLLLTHTFLMLIVLALTLLTAIIPSSMLGFPTIPGGGGIGDGLESVPGLYCAAARSRAWATFFGPQLGFVVLGLGMQVWTGVVVWMTNRRKFSSGKSNGNMEGRGNVGTVAIGDDGGVAGLASVEERHGKRYMVMAQLRLQWRSGLMAILLLVCWLNYMILFTVVYLPQDRIKGSSTWIREWVTCLFLKRPNGHAECASIPSADLPNIYGVITAIDLTALIGLYSILVYAARRGIIREWKQLIRNRQRERKRRRNEREDDVDDDETLSDQSFTNMAPAGGRKELVIGGKDGVRGLAGVVLEGRASDVGSAGGRKKEKSSVGGVGGALGGLLAQSGLEPGGRPSTSSSNAPHTPRRMESTESFRPNHGTLTNSPAPHPIRKTTSVGSMNSSTPPSPRHVTPPPSVINIPQPLPAVRTPSQSPSNAGSPSSVGTAYFPPVGQQQGQQGGSPTTPVSPHGRRRAPSKPDAVAPKGILKRPSVGNVGSIGVLPGGASGAGAGGRSFE
ncbi:hypothetical protein HDU97_006586 [Phlyctochytrium planicorne]|nr:hypothetical protein HDU97_006586 [Phlyctochytrium planicorne]